MAPVQLAGEYDRLAKFRSIHRMIRGAVHVRSFSRIAAEHHAEFMEWGAGVVGACEAVDSRSHDRKRYNRLLWEARQLADAWAYTLEMAQCEDACTSNRDRLENMVLGA